MPKYRVLIYPAAAVQFLLVTGDCLKIKEVGAERLGGNTEDVLWPDSCDRDVHCDGDLGVQPAPVPAHARTVLA